MFWFILFTIIVLYIFHQCFWRLRNYPPGPIPWPLIGNIPLLDFNNSDNQLMDFRNKYGNIFTLWLPEPTIFVGGVDELKEAFIKNSEKTAGRPQIKMWKLLVGGNYGLVLSNDSFWRSQRKFALQVLRDLGVGRPILEDAVLNQASDVCAYFKSLNGQPIDPSKIFTTCVGNIIHQLAFGSTINLEDDLINEFRNKITETSEIFKHPLTLLMEIWEPIKYLRCFAGASFQKSLKTNDEIIAYIKDQIKEHRQTIDYDNAPRDYIDAFLIEKRKHDFKEGEDETGEWSDLQLIASCYNLFEAGMETTSSTTYTFIFYMLHYPEIQAKIHEEIDRVLGKDKIITMSDQSKLPYFNACLQEAQRLITLLPINPFRQTLDDIVVNGYLIPKGTNICPQFECVHKDGNVFKDPLKFDPSRFLNEENNNYKKDENVTPFSIGKRACIGESLARMELFLFNATFFQHFEFQPIDPNNLPPFEYEYSFSKNIKPFKVRIIERK